MKKTLVFLVVIALLFSAMPAISFAGGHHEGGHGGDRHHGGHHRGGGNPWPVIGGLLAGAVILEAITSPRVVYIEPETRYYAPPPAYYYREPEPICYKTVETGYYDRYGYWVTTGLRDVRVPCSRW